MNISQNVIKIVVQSLSNVQLFANPWTTVCQPSLSFTSSLSLCKLIPIQLAMSSNHQDGFTLSLQRSQTENLSQTNPEWQTAAAAKSLQSCLTLCDPIDGSPPGSSVPGILQARVLEWVAISFFNMYMHAKSLQSCPTLCDPIDSSPPGSSVPGILQARTLEWVAMSFFNACMHAKLLQSCLTLCNPMDSSPAGSSVHGILQARILEWLDISFSNRVADQKLFISTSPLEFATHSSVLAWRIPWTEEPGNTVQGVTESQT